MQCTKDVNAEIERITKIISEFTVYINGYTDFVPQRVVSEETARAMAIKIVEGK